MNLLKIFKKHTNYPLPVIPPKALELINALDTILVDNAVKISDSQLSLVHLELQIWDQMKSTDKIIAFFKEHIDPDYAYIPRSIAFITSQDGTWHLIIGIRRIATETNNIAATMWIDLLTRTNNAR